MNPANHWTLDPEVTFLNHGSFGACPRTVLARQQELRDELESSPVQFMIRRLQPLLDTSRNALASLIGADPCDLVFVSNATAGVNAVLRSRIFEPGDEILVTSHGYNACNNAARAVAEGSGAKVVFVDLPFPLRSPDEIVDAVVEKLSDRTRIAVIDHITSATGLVLPIERIAADLANRGIDLLVDGAHTPGQLPVDVGSLAAPYYTGNCHKWLCAPKGAGFLHVRKDRQEDLLPSVISHGYNSPRPGRSRFSDLFDWPGTTDPTPACCVAEAIDFLRNLHPGGLEELMEKNRALTLEARDLLCRELGIDPPAPDDMIASMAALPLPDDPGSAPLLDTVTVPTPTPRFQVDLYERHRIEVPVNYFPRHPNRVLRISAQAYNNIDQYAHLARALTEELAR